MPDVTPWLRGLYAIVDDGAVSPQVMPAVARALVTGGVRVLQLRLKKGCDAEREALQASVASALSGADVLFVVNDRVDLTRCLMDIAPAGVRVGVHLGQEDVAPEVARQILGQEAVIGWSTHTPSQVSAARSAHADYLGFGPIFGTGSKARADATVGIEGLKAALVLADLPVVAIGGLDGARGQAAMEAGASAVAMIAALYRGLELSTPSGRRALTARARELCGCLNREPVT